MLSDAFAGFDKDWVIELPPDTTVVRGLAKAQVSSVTLSVPSGSSTEVTLHANVRAHFYSDPGTTPLPEPIHGEIRAAFEVRKVPSSSGGTRLQIKPSAQDAKIQFIAAPGTGLTAADESKIAAQLRKALREGLTMPPVDLPGDFPFTEFKGLGSGSNQVIALPLQLSGAGTPASGITGLTQSFIGSSGFAFAASKEHVTRLIDINAIRDALASRTITIRIGRWGVYYNITYRLRFSQAPPSPSRAAGSRFRAGSRWKRTLGGRQTAASASRRWSDLCSTLPHQYVSLRRLGEPDVDESWFIPHSAALSIVRTRSTRRQAATVAASTASSPMQEFEWSERCRRSILAATVTYAAVEITPHGVIVRGDIASAGRAHRWCISPRPMAGTAFTAFQSWIPAGRIDRFIWSWVEHTRPATPPLGSVSERSITDEHRFILPKAGGHFADQPDLSADRGHPDLAGRAEAGICRRHHLPGVGARSRRRCSVLVGACHGADLAAGRGRPTIALREAIAGHVSVQSDAPERAFVPKHAGVFRGLALGEAPGALNAALAARRKQVRR